MEKTFKTNIEELLDEDILLPMKVSLRDQMLIFPEDMSDEKIDELTQASFAVTGIVKNGKAWKVVSETEDGVKTVLNVPSTGNFTAKTITGADCTLGLCIDVCQFEVVQISEINLIVKIIAVKR